MRQPSISISTKGAIFASGYMGYFGHYTVPPVRIVAPNLIIAVRGSSDLGVDVIEKVRPKLVKYSGSAEEILQAELRLLAKNQGNDFVPEFSFVVGRRNLERKSSIQVEEVTHLSIVPTTNTHQDMPLKDMREEAILKMYSMTKSLCTVCGIDLEMYILCRSGIYSEWPPAVLERGPSLKIECNCRLSNPQAK